LGLVLGTYLATLDLLKAGTVNQAKFAFLGAALSLLFYPLSAVFTGVVCFGLGVFA